MFFAVPTVLGAEIFRFKYTEGQRYRILSEVDQSVYLNGNFSHQADQLNRITVLVDQVLDGKGHHRLDYRNSAEARRPNQIYQFDRNYDAQFWRDERGYYSGLGQAFVPTVRDVPVFPDADLKPGASWTAEGWEVHDLRQGFDIQEPFEFPVPVTYRYEGKAKYEDREYDLILIRYNVFYRPQKKLPYAKYPILISGYSNQRLYWDNVAGRPYFYDEEYLIMLSLSSGEQISFEGSARAKVFDLQADESEKSMKVLKDSLDELDLSNVSVRENEDGLVLSLENIQFNPDSSLLTQAEKEKLDKIGEVLSAHPEFDLLITGHTALAGNEEGRQLLSEERAEAVGNYLLAKKIRPREQLMFRGLGAKEPIADNSSEAGRAKNRRVEITVLKN